MDFFNVISLSEARQKLIDNFTNTVVKTEKINIKNCLGRVLANDVISDCNVPGFNRSTVDGYAVKCENTFGASESIPSLLEVVANVKMGEQIDLELKDAQAVYVPTGGMIPKGCSAVVMIEYCEMYDEVTLAVYRPASNGENIVYEGEDIKKGELIFEKGRTLSATDIGALAALGISEAEVYVLPSVYIISTGDELVDIDAQIKIGQIRDINTYSIGSLVKNLGCNISGHAVVKDNFQSLYDKIKQACAVSDIVIISGGSSVGQKDYSYKAINEICGGNIIIKGIAIKPGKPTIVGNADGKAIFALPGHPVASVVVYKALVEFVIKKMMGAKEEKIFVTAQMDINLPSSPGKTTYQMVKLYTKDDKIMATPIFGKSGLITVLSSSDGYIEIPDNLEGVNKGQDVKVYRI